MNGEAVVVETSSSDHGDMPDMPGDGATPPEIPEGGHGPRDGSMPPEKPDGERPSDMPDKKNESQ